MPAPLWIFADASSTVTSLLVAMICGAARWSMASVTVSSSVTFMPRSRMRSRRGISSSVVLRLTKRFTRAVFVSSGLSDPKSMTELAQAQIIEEEEVHIDGGLLGRNRTDILDRQQHIHGFAFLDASVPVADRLFGAVIQHLMSKGKPRPWKTRDCQRGLQGRRHEPVVLFEQQGQGNGAVRAVGRQRQSDAVGGALPAVEFSQVKQDAVQSGIVALMFWPETGTAGPSPGWSR